jgi:hypothetical protein
MDENPHQFIDKIDAHERFHRLEAPVPRRVTSSWRDGSAIENVLSKRRKGILDGRVIQAPDQLRLGRQDECFLGLL